MCNALLVEDVEGGGEEAGHPRPADEPRDGVERAHQQTVQREDRVDVEVHRLKPPLERQKGQNCWGWDSYNKLYLTL